MDFFFEVPEKKKNIKQVWPVPNKEWEFSTYILDLTCHSSLYSILPLIFSLCFSSLPYSNLALLHCIYFRGPFQLTLRKGNYNELTTATAKQLS